VSQPTLDEIGKWSEIKLEIIREYARPYSQILAKHPKLYHLYIDGFAGAGWHIAKGTGQKIAGSPLNVVGVKPRFREYHFVELDTRKAAHLRQLFVQDPDVRIHEGDCNNVVLNTLLPGVRYDKYRRALCLLDPYGLHLDWDVIQQAGAQKTIDLLLNFPLMDMNMNVLWQNPDSVKPEQSARMTRYWGDESWKLVAYSTEPGLFGDFQKKAPSKAIAKAFAERLKEKAGFEYVAKPLPMRNLTNAIVYFLFFASHNATAHKIISSIFKKHGAGGGV